MLMQGAAVQGRVYTKASGPIERLLGTKGVLQYSILAYSVGLTSSEHNKYTKEVEEKEFVEKGNI